MNTLRDSNRVIAIDTSSMRFSAGLTGLFEVALEFSGSTENASHFSNWSFDASDSMRATVATRARKTASNLHLVAVFAGAAFWRDWTCSASFVGGRN